MHGNVAEWCLDGIRTGMGIAHAQRGGGWRDGPENGLATSRVVQEGPAQFNSTGLRVARVPAPPEPKAEVPPPAYTNSVGMEFQRVPKGKSWLGNKGGKPGDKEVEIPADFFLGRYEVTQEEWQKVVGSNPSNFTRTGAEKDAVKDIPDADLKRFPVENVSWEDAQLFLARLNERDKQAGWVYRLPTEVEWEYACRGGPNPDRAASAFDYYFEQPTTLARPDQANFAGPGSMRRACKVGNYTPNRLGLYDMHGNVFEWCADTDTTKGGGTWRVRKGGGWQLPAAYGRANSRESYPLMTRGKDQGLRVARVPVGK
jgi:formylglycine-generating enzyme required for sulfatase activity